MNHLFTETRSTEPHRLRRREILRAHPEIARLTGYDRRTIGVTVAVVLTQLGLAAALQWLTAGRPLAVRAGGSLLAALSVGAVLTHWLAMSMHEATHNLAARTREQNVGVGLLANLPMVVPAAMTFRRYHLTHHTQLGVLERDTDLPHRLEAQCIGNRGPLKALWWAGYFFVYIVRGATFARFPNRLELLNLGLMVGVDAALLRWLGPTALLYLTLSLVIAHGLHPVAAHFLHEHYVFATGQETYSYYGPLNRVTFNVGYHVEHHDFMNVPGWRLPELHALARPYYARLASHRSWTGVLWRFITDPEMGFASRIVRRTAVSS